MAKTLPSVDVVTVGVGWTGGIVAAECAKAGLKVVGLERGQKRGTEDYLNVHDEYRYAIRYDLMQNLSKETVSFRNDRNMKALPMRQLGSFLLGEGLGGSSTHWNGMTFRFLPYDFQIKTLTDKRYGPNKLGPDYLIQDWGLTYDQLEPYMDKFEKTAGISGDDKNTFSGKRSNPYPTGPMKKTPMLTQFEKAAKNLKLTPYMVPSANLSEVYKNPDGETINACQYCGFCERFGCEYGAKSSAEVTVVPTALKTGNFDLRYNSNVVEILKQGNKATGVRYIDTVSGEEFIQPANAVVLTSYVFNNAKLLMVSNIGERYDPTTGKGTLGRNYCYQILPGAAGFFDEQYNTFMGAGSLGVCLDDYNGDNFDHSDLDFIHGGNLALTQTGARPIGSNPTPPDTPTWGPEFKKQSIYYYTRSFGIGAQGASMPHKENYLSLDPTYKDAYGLPLVQLTYNFTDQDRALHKYISARAADIMKEMGAKTIVPNAEIKDYNIVPYQTTHNTGGTVMSLTPEQGVVNNYLQHWDVDNLFAVSAGNFAHNSGYNPTGTLGALAYRCAEGVIKYSQSGGSLV
ncbi:GMC family oxidoreductase [Lysinibacillus irui]|uniref:GMC family oxidoreductase n=1 Tax=Lysinibacillus irui TaxID=2998077 RepID=A0AAJ5RKL0_9BACI|nr:MULTISPECIES: GMC family oxidoreductase [Lysinibacillus]MEA0556301.1 GMC family oxidoreductase [Lysinibacillus irui]MEA0562760.1 GMC family oxidoreductase [Lysinibacillus irui]MEA0977374.1 GMC family oxidoreductase [Lysinibacillus irui]MEA1043528.1 GMC family oxidoreductase [Lysinibacillus irui]WDV07073.1 GMC family oxidoreductase [Lysinibacillus irui]